MILYKVKKGDKEKMLHLKFKSTFENVDLAILEIIKYLKEKCSINDRSIIFLLDFAARELLNNAVEHGNGFDPDKMIVCNVKYKNKRITIEVWDEGKGFFYKHNPINKEEPIQMRCRGIHTLILIGFNIKAKKNKISAVLDIRKGVFCEKRDIYG